MGNPLVSVIVPIHNAELWLDECLESILAQDFNGKIELSAFLDACTDNSIEIIKRQHTEFKIKGIDFVVLESSSEKPKGVGFSKNKAVEQSHGDYLCFLDADDVMHKSRIQKQFLVAKEHPDALVGCCFDRKPADSTVRFTKWANSLTPAQLHFQIYTSHGPTVIMPSWFCHRNLFDRVKGFDEGGKGIPEDLIFFYEHLKLGGKVLRVDDCLLTYRYHPSATTFSIEESTIWNIRIKAIEENIIHNWESFTIWNAGKQGKRFYRSLQPINREKVLMFCDVDEKKIQRGCYTYEEAKVIPKPKIPIVHFSQAKPPFIICMKLDLTGGAFEANLQSLNLTEGVDYFHFN